MIRRGPYGPSITSRSPMTAARIRSTSGDAAASPASPVTPSARDAPMVHLVNLGGGFPGSSGNRRGQGQEAQAEAGQRRHAEDAGPQLRGPADPGSGGGGGPPRPPPRPG